MADALFLFFHTVFRQEFFFWIHFMRARFELLVGNISKCHLT